MQAPALLARLPARQGFQAAETPGGRDRAHGALTDPNIARQPRRYKYKLWQRNSFSSWLLLIRSPRAEGRDNKVSSLKWSDLSPLWWSSRFSEPR